MVVEQNRTVEALKYAIQMEIDGKEYYLKISSESRNPIGKKLLARLAAEEDIHRAKFVMIFDAIRNKKGWPKTDFVPDSGRQLRTIFSRALAEVGAEVHSLATEIGAVDVAIDKEKKSYDFYIAQSKVTTGTEKEFYESVAGEEHEHALILGDYSQYMKDPSVFFIEKEHHGLDGG